MGKFKETERILYTRYFNAKQRKKLYTDFSPNAVRVLLQMERKDGLTVFTLKVTPMERIHIQGGRYLNKCDTTQKAVCFDRFLCAVVHASKAQRENMIIYTEAIAKSYAELVGKLNAMLIVD